MTKTAKNDTEDKRDTDSQRKRKAIGFKIRLARRELGLYQYELAEWVGVDSTHISMIECGKRLPSLGLLSRLATYLEKTSFDHEEIINDMKQEGANVKILKFRKNTTKLDESPTFHEITELLSYHFERGDLHPDDVETLLEKMRSDAHSALIVRGIVPYIPAPMKDPIEVQNEPVASCQQ